jgi:hypothetical protein
VATSAIKITYGGETVVLACDLTRTSAPLVVDGIEIGAQTVRARRPDLAVCLAAQYAWPEAHWPTIPDSWVVPHDWPAGHGGESSWEALTYEVLSEVADAGRP